MALNENQIYEINMNALAFLKKRRPHIEHRDKVDLAYRIENQSVIVFGIRPNLLFPEQKMDIPIAKTTYIKTQKQWKIFWMRADLKWHGYEPDMYTDSIGDFFRVVDEDAYGCFFG